MRRRIYAKPSVIALCDGHSSASAGIIARRAELTFPNPALSGLGGSNRRDCVCQRWFNGKRFDHCLLSVWKSEIPVVGSVLERGKTSNWRLNGSGRVKRKSNRKRTAARKISLKRPQQLPFVIERPPCKRFSQG